MARLIVLDRDGVINYESNEYVKSVGEWRPLPGSLEAIAELVRHGFDVVVVSNQSGVGRGLFSAATLEDIHTAMQAAVGAAGGRLAGIYVCPHTPAEGCDCRKPKPGLLHRVAADFGVPLTGVPVIGDKRSDIAAAQAVGARPILVLTGHGVEARAELGHRVETYADLAAAAAALIAEQEN